MSSTAAYSLMGTGRGCKNYLVEGISCTGKTSVCDELRRRGYHSIHGDRVLAYQGDPRTGEPMDGLACEHLSGMSTRSELWWPIKVMRHRSFAADPRNFACFIDVFDGVFVLEVDLETLNRRLAARPEGEWGVRSKCRGTSCAIAACYKNGPSKERNHNQLHGTHL